MQQNLTTKSQIKAYLMAGKVLTSCDCARLFITADCRKFVSLLRAEGLKIEDELVENANKKRFKRYFISQDGTV